MITKGMPHIIEQERKERLNRFTPYVSILPWFNVTLLHKFYINIFQEFENQNQETRDAGPSENFMEDDLSYKNRSICCADLLHSPFVNRLNHNVFSIQAVLQDKYRMLMQDKPEIIQKIGEFMLACTIDCKEIFLSSIYLEHYRIEANLIINPNGEAERISQHIVSRLNQSPNLSTKKESVAYHLNILKNNSTNPEHTELIKFLEGFQKYDETDGKIPTEWTKLKKETEKGTNSVTVQLPEAIRSSILEQIENQASRTTQSKLLSLFVGIDEYKLSNINPLSAAVKDAISMQKLITENQVLSQANFQRILLNEEASLRNIVKVIEESAGEVKSGDTFFFFFAGYGGIEENPHSIGSLDTQIPSSESSNGKPCLIPYDHGSGSYGMNFDELNHLLNKFPKDCKIVMVLDCGFARLPQRVATKIEPRFRSLAQPLRQRKPSEYLYHSTKTIFPEPNFSGIMLISETNDSIESFEQGQLTRHVLKEIENEGLELSYEALTTKVMKQVFISDAMEVVAKTFGNFNLLDSFLGDHLEAELSPAMQAIKECLETNNSRLSLAGLDLNRIPEAVFDLKGLKILDLSNNNFAELPLEIVDLQELEELYVSQNNLRTVNPMIRKLPSLRHIHLDENALNSFPHELLDIETLESIFLQYNEIKFIPVRIKDNRNLQEINVEGNTVLNLPKGTEKVNPADISNMIERHKRDSRSKTREVLAIGIDRDSKLPYIEKELRMIKNVISRVDNIGYLTLSNPNLIELFYSIYHQQNALSILHIAAETITELVDETNEVHKLTPEDWIEMFKCIRSKPFNNCLLFLNCNNGFEFGKVLIDRYFSRCLCVPDLLNDDVAYEVSNQVYSSLASGESIEDIYEELNSTSNSA